jgi:molybdopterin synthase catalytic subunit
MTPLIAITREPLDLAGLVAAVGTARDGHDGAVASFSGLVRDHNQGRRVHFLDYECYEPLAVKALERIASEIAETWPSVRLGVHHRIGRVDIGEPSVIIAAASPHRADAFAACRYTI